ncbi:hypothetical protein MMC30_003846 [Trapelia coarctata]|nr:hypothetical protein [Trapelia coarctata]
MFRSHALQRVDIPLQRLGWPCPVYLRLPSYVAHCRGRGLQTTASPQPTVPFRKQLKDEAKQRRAVEKQGFNTPKTKSNAPLEKWELTVGIEVHAQLNTERKLFSTALTSINDDPNSHVALFDLAVPGAQPIFQKATLLPALRAAVALQCSIQPRSSFDRKHYFYQDQPAGYQITQYYEPFAKEGHITLFDHDGIAPEDGKSVKIGIKQIQMEQDTAKTVQQPPDTMLLDFNRVGHPLIEIITLPQIRHPQTAAACVRKIQSILQAVNAVTTGMEMGGLRADVNVSVRRRNDEKGPHGYHGITGLGQRTEIKNLSSFKAVEDAIIAERDRQINVLENGGSIEGETRGWTLGIKETKKLRGKEGEVDYRYMPDPDLPPVFIHDELISHITNSLPNLPDRELRILVDGYGLSVKDAKTLMGLDDGDRLDYFYTVFACLKAQGDHLKDYRELGKTAANWTLHELGGLLSASEKAFSPDIVPAEALASIVWNLLRNRITGRTAKQLLSMVFEGDTRAVYTIIEEESLRLHPLSAEEYQNMAENVISENPQMAEKVKKGQTGKLQFFVGQMMRQGEGRVEAVKAEAILRQLLGLASSILYQVKISTIYLIIGPANQNAITGSTDILAQVADFMRTDSTLLIIWVLTMWFVKFSFLAFFWKLGHNVRRQRLLWWIALVWTVATLIVSFAIPNYDCSFGTDSGILRCATSSSGIRRFRTILEISTAFDIITEALILILPINLLWKVKISLRQKLTLGAILSLTVFIIAVAIARIILVLDVASHLDVTWLNTLSVVEQGVAILVACLVSYRALFTAKSVSPGAPAHKNPSEERILRLQKSVQSVELEEREVGEENPSEV